MKNDPKYNFQLNYKFPTNSDIAIIKWGKTGANNKC